MLKYVIVFIITTEKILVISLKKITRQKKNFFDLKKFFFFMD
jgi:hypothetical protein